MPDMSTIVDALRKRSKRCNWWSFVSISFLVLILVLGAYAFYFVDNEAKERIKIERELLTTFLAESTSSFEKHLGEISKHQRKLRQELSKINTSRIKKRIKEVETKRPSESKAIDRIIKGSKNASIQDTNLMRFLEDYIEYSNNFDGIIRPKTTDFKYSSIFSKRFESIFSDSLLRPMIPNKKEFIENLNKEIPGVIFDSWKSAWAFNGIEEIRVPVNVEIIDKEIDEIKALQQKLASKSYRLIKNDNGSYSPAPIQGVLENGSSIEIYREVVTRITLVILVFIALQVVVSVFRYNARLSGFYSGRADAIEFWWATGQSSLSTEEFSLLMSSLTPDNYDFGKQPKTPIDHSFELAKHLTLLKK